VARKRIRQVILNGRTLYPALEGKSLRPKLSKPLEAVVERHANELWGKLFMSLATDDVEEGQNRTVMLLEPAPRQICKDVVRRIIVNALKVGGAS
jgi:hypothetical protein